jgi:putative methionine-R-sulfoxide reductase with GAF domain
MRFTEINVFGVYVALMSVMMVAAWVGAIGLRRIAARFGLLRQCLAPGHVCRLHDRALHDRAHSRFALRSRWLKSMSN